MQVALQEVDARALAGALRMDAPTPLHERLETELRRLIRSGEMQPGSRLPGEYQLAALLGVSRHTIRHALGVLASEGLLRRQRGARGGTLVVPPADRVPQVIERGLGGFYAFAWEVPALGGDQRSYILERGSIAATSELAERLELAPGTLLERIVRLRTANGEPLVLETAFLPATLIAGIDQLELELGALYDALERVHQVRVLRARETIRPIALERSVARLLRVRSGSPAFAIERRTFSEGGPIEWQESVVRGDRYLYSVDLPRLPDASERPAAG
jgi:GntR family transcriptional regulator